MTVMTAMATVNTVTTIIVIITMVTMVITTVMMIAAMEMGNISQKPALSTVMSIDVSIDTEIISGSESSAYSADHPDHSKSNFSFISLEDTEELKW